MRPVLKKIACFLLAGMLIGSGVQTVFAGEGAEQGAIQSSSGQYTDENLSSPLVQDTVSSPQAASGLPAKVRRLAQRYSKERKKALYFELPLIQVVRNRTIILALNKKVPGITYKSSNPKVATVNKKGIVTTRKRGYAVITAKTKKYTCHTVVYVFPKRNTLAGKVNDRAASAQTILNPSGEADANNRKKTIVIAGSSSADRWVSISQALSGFNVVNTAIGGSTAQEWKSLYSRLILPYHPDAVILLVGSNDIGKNGAISGEECAARIQNVIAGIRNALGDRVPIFYISILINWNRKAAWPQEKTSNRLMKRYCSTEGNTYYIDVASRFLGKNGKPNKALFVSDRIHPNKKGYQIFNSVVGKKVRRVLNG